MVTTKVVILASGAYSPNLPAKHHRLQNYNCCLSEKLASSSNYVKVFAFIHLSLYCMQSLLFEQDEKKNPLCNMRQLMLSQVGMGHFPVVYGCDVPPFPLAGNSCSLFMNVVVIC